MVSFIKSDKVLYLGGVLSFAIGHAFFSIIGNEFSPPYEPSLVWPAAGFSFAIILYYGPKMTPGFLLGYLLEIIYQEESLLSFDRHAIAIFIIATTVLAGYFLTHFIKVDLALHKLSDISWVLGVGALLSLLNALFGVAVLQDFNNSSVQYFELVYTWFGGNIVGILVLTPAILFAIDLKSIKRSNRSHLERVAITLFFCGLCVLGFGQVVPEGVDSALLGIGSVILFSWTASRFQRITTILFLLLISAVALWSAAQGIGIFVNEEATSINILTWSFVIAINFLVLFILTVFSSLKDAHENALNMQLKLQSFLDQAPDIITIINCDGEVEFVNHKDTITDSSNIYDQLSEVDAEKLRKRVNRVIQSRQIEQNVYAVPIPSAENPSWFSYRVGPIVEDSEVTGLIIVTRDITRERKHKKVLLDNEIRFKHIYENAPVMMHSIDQLGNICDVNKKWLEETGYEREEVIGRPATFLMSQESKTRALSEIIPQFWRDGFIRQVPYRYLRKDGIPMDIVLDCDVTVNPITKDKISLSVVHDVSEMRRMREDLLESKDRFTTFMDNNPAIATMKDAQGRLIYINPAFESKFLLDNDVWFHKTHYELWPTFTAMQFCLHDDEVLLSGKPKSYETLITFAGQTQYWQMVKFRFSDAAGRQFIASMGLDLTTAKNAATAKVKAEKNYESIFHQAVYGIFQVKPSGRLIKINPAFAQMMGYETTHDLLDKVENTRSLQVDLDKHEQLRDSLNNDGEVKAMEYQVYCADLTTMWVSETSRTVFDTENNVLYYEGSIEDISERKRQEQKLVEMTENLGRLVDERTDELSIANKELQSFNYSVSHDLQAPVRSMANFAQFLTDDYGDILPVQAKDYLDRIQSNAIRMGKRIEALLNFSHLSKQKINRQHYQLTKLVRYAVEDLALSYEGREIEFEIEEIGEAYIDKPLFMLILQNLIQNAIKFTGNKSVARILVGQGMTPAGEPYIFVKDNGAGFDNAYAHNLFVAFQRLHTATEFDGSGIGLAQCERIISRHGGKIWATGEVDKGATFCFTIPPPADLTNINNTANFYAKS